MLHFFNDINILTSSEAFINFLCQYTVTFSCGYVSINLFKLLDNNCKISNTSELSKIT